MNIKEEVGGKSAKRSTGRKKRTRNDSVVGFSKKYVREMNK